MNGPSAKPNDGGPQFSLIDRHDRAFESFLLRAIRDFNTITSPAHRLARKRGALRPLNLIVRSGTGEILGGLAALTYWDWLDVDKFFLPADLRGRGLGSRLLAAAEAEAISRGCRHVRLTTYEFQARQFYEQHGYTVVGRLEDYPPGSVFYWMRKELGTD